MLSTAVRSRSAGSRPYSDGAPAGTKCRSVRWTKAKGAALAASTMSAGPLPRRQHLHVGRHALQRRVRLRPLGYHRLQVFVNDARDAQDGGLAAPKGPGVAKNPLSAASSVAPRRTFAAPNRLPLRKSDTPGTCPAVVHVPCVLAAPRCRCVTTRWRWRDAVSGPVTAARQAHCRCEGAEPPWRLLGPARREVTAARWTERPTRDAKRAHVLPAPPWGSLTHHAA